MDTLTGQPREEAALTDWIEPTRLNDAHRDVLLAVQRGLEAHWENELPRIAVIERNDIINVYVSTMARLGPEARADLRGAVRAALAPYARLAPFTNVVFLTRAPHRAHAA